MIVSDKLYKNEADGGPEWVEADPEVLVAKQAGQGAAEEGVHNQERGQERQVQARRNNERQFRQRWSKD